MIPHEPVLAFTRKNDKRKKQHDNVSYVNDLCPDSWNPKFWIFSIILRLFSAFGIFLLLFVAVMTQILHKEGAR